jgi:hypothetical protein
MGGLKGGRTELKMNEQKGLMDGRMIGLKAG